MVGPGRAVYTENCALTERKLRTGVLVASTRLIAAPFWLWQSERRRVQTAEVEIAELKRQLDPRDKNKLIREGLARLTDEGGQLAGACEDEQQGLPSDLAIQWDKSVVQSLRHNFDESFVIIVHN